MPSLAERAAAPASPPDQVASSSAPAEDRGGRRPIAEWVLHLAACGLLAWALVGFLGPARSAGVANVAARRLHAALATWTTTSNPAAVHVTLDSIPSVGDRDWLAALPGAGTAVSWSDQGLRPLAVDAEAVADPVGVTRVRVAAPGGAAIAVNDGAGGLLDTLRLPSRTGAGGASGATMTVPGFIQQVDVREAGGRTLARGVVRDSLLLRRVLVLGRVSWESRFVVDALEERGWEVDARLALAPRNDIVQGIGESALSIDTGRYAAVVVLDSSPVATTAAVLRYVRSGGGVVLAGTAADLVGLRPILPGVPDAVRGAGRLTPLDSEPDQIRATLALVPIGRLAGDAVSLERRPERDRAGGIVVAQAARRIGPGRVVQVGYLDTWRWRMIAAHGVRAHCDWWAGVVRSVAYAPPLRREDQAGADPAPLLALRAMLGPPTAPTLASGGDDGARWSEWIFAAVLAVLLLEWASRRLRGAR